MFTVLLFLPFLACSFADKELTVPSVELEQIKIDSDTTTKKHIVSSGEFFSTLLQKYKFKKINQISNSIKATQIEWFDVDRVQTGQRIDFTTSSETGVSFRVYHRYRRNEYLDIA